MLTGAGCRGEEGKTMPKKLTGMKIVMVIASRNYRDEELETPRKILESEGAKITLVCSSLETAKGMLSGTAKPDVLLKDVKVSDYNAVIFVGGSGATEYWNNAVAHHLAKQAAEQDKVIAAICIAPVTLANAGLLKGKKATVFSSEAAQIKKAGAEYTGASVETDGRIITANGPDSAEEFGRAVVKLLTTP